MTQAASGHAVQSQEPLTNSNTSSNTSCNRFELSASCQDSQPACSLFEMSPGKLRLVARDAKGQEWVVHGGGGAITIGRRPCQDLVLTFKAVSGKHAAIFSLPDHASRFCVQVYVCMCAYIFAK